MSTSLHTSGKHPQLRSAGVALVVLAATAFFVFASAPVRVQAWVPSVATTASPILLRTSAMLSIQDSDEVTLTLRVGGFDPAELTRPAGRLLLSVDNRSGVAEITLLLKSENGELVREIKVPAKALDWAEEIDLPAGRYVLSVVNHPAWVCRITAQ